MSMNDWYFKNGVAAHSRAVSAADNGSLIRLGWLPGSVAVRYRSTNEAQVHRTTAQDDGLINTPTNRAGAATLPTACWCEATTLPVPIELVGVTTFSCGRRGCGS